MIAAADRLGRAFGAPSAITRPLLVLLGLAATLSFFTIVDPYHDAFFGTRYVFVYNLMRLAVVVYLILAVCAAGSFALDMLAPGLARENALSRLLASFFAGVGVWHVYMLLIGQLGLLNLPAALIAAVPAITFKTNDLAALLGRAKSEARDAWQSATLRQRVALALAGSAVIVTVVLTLLTKGLYPGGGHDYWQHYFYFFDFALDAQSTLPNDAWYHFWYSKGMGLTFLAMLFSDPLGGQLAGYAFLLAGALLVFVFSRRLHAGRVLAASAAALLLLIYVHTPGTDAIASNGGWGQLQKNHTTTGVLIFGICWLQFEMLLAPRAERRGWLVVAVFAIVGLGIASAQSLLLIGLFSVILLAVLLLRRAWEDAVRTFVIGFACGVTIVAVFLHNWLVTGLPSDQYITEFWPIVRFDWLQRWDLLLNAVLLHQAHDALAQMAATREIGAILSMMNNAFFLYLLAPIIVVSIIEVFAALTARAAGEPDRGRIITGLGVLGALLLATVAVAALAGSEQHVSFPRYAEFVPFLIITFGAGAMALPGLRPARSAHVAGAILGIILPVAAVLLSASFALNLDRGRADAAFMNGLRFATGQMSIYDGFKHQEGEVGTFDFGAIYPGAEGAWLTVGPGVKIWSFHAHTYCQLPGCWIEGFVSMRSGLDFEDLYFGEPEAARSALQRADMNYFLFAKDLRISTDLSAISLFRPENIGKYLGIKWTDGTSYLLTWLGPGILSLPEDWIARYGGIIGAPNQAFPLLKRELSYKPPDAQWGSQWPLEWWSRTAGDGRQ